MDLDKLKKVALDKTMAFKIFKDTPEKGKQDKEFDEFADSMDVRMDSSPDGSEDMASTRRFNLREVLSGLRKAADSIEDALDDESPNTSDPVQTVDMQQAERQSTSSGSPAAAPAEPQAAAVPDEVTSCLNDIKNGIDELKSTVSADTQSPELAEQAAKLDDISRRLSSLRNMLEMHTDSTTKSIVNINAKLNAQDDRITDIVTSLGSVSKLNDSVFDLKNTQMNTRNSIDTLSASFSRLKRRMTAGVTVISILSAVLIVLEVLNLLS